MDDLMDDVIDRMEETSGTECPECETMNGRNREECKKCGSRLSR